MGKFLIKVDYSSGSWARMIRSPGSRTAAVSDLIRLLGGELECLYWNLDSCAGVAIADLPDAVTAAAVITGITQTGAFKGAEAHELLDEHQLDDALLLARDTSGVFNVPGYSAGERPL